MKIYNFDKNNIFTTESIAKIDPMESRLQGKNVYLLPRNATFIKPIPFNAELEQIKFNEADQKWDLVDIKQQGAFYLKANGQKYNEIAKKDLHLYITQEPYILEGDKVKFDEQLNDWIYTIKSISRMKDELRAEVEKKYIEHQKVELTLDGDMFIVATKGSQWADFEKQVNKAQINGNSDLIALNTKGELKIIGDVPFAVLQPTYKILCKTSVGNLAIKKQLLFNINKATTKKQLNAIKIEYLKNQPITIR